MRSNVSTLNLYMLKNNCLLLEILLQIYKINF